MAAASNTNHHSPKNAGGDRQGAPAPARGVASPVASPWTQIVRGGESESIVSSSTSAAAAVPPSSPSSLPVIQEQDRHSSSDSSPSKLAASAVVSASSSPEESAVESQPECSDNSNGNGNAAKKSAWNKPSNGGADGGPVMGAFSWPALSESTRASPKSSSSESLKALSDGSISASQGIGIASSSTQKQTIANNASPVSTPNHATPPTRHKSTKRGGGGNVSVNGGSHQPLPLTLGSVVSSAVEMSANNAGKPGSSVLESSPRDPTTHKETGQTGGFGSHSHNISSPRNDHGQQQRNSFRRGNGGSHPRGDGHYHNNYGGRDRGNHDLNLNRSFNGREGHLQPHRGVPRGGFIRHQPPPHSSTPLIPPPVPVRPFANPMVYPEMPSPMIYVSGHHPDSLRSMHLVAPMPPHAMYYSPVLDPQLHTKIVNQIDYYFSNENLIKDTFLRQNMDDQGWVPVILIAGFKKVMQLTENIQLILEAVRASTTVEVQGDKVRRRNDWMRWLMPPVQFPNVSSPLSPGSSSHDILAANVQNVSLEERINKQGHDEAVLSRSSSGDVNSRSQQSSSEETGPATFQTGSESSVSAKSSSK